MCLKSANSSTLAAGVLVIMMVTRECDKDQQTCKPDCARVPSGNVQTTSPALHQHIYVCIAQLSAAPTTTSRPASLRSFSLTSSWLPNLQAHFLHLPGLPAQSLTSAATIIKSKILLSICQRCCGPALHQHHVKASISLAALLHHCFLYWPNLLRCDPLLVLNGNTLGVTFPNISNIKNRVLH